MYGLLGRGRGKERAGGGECRQLPLNVIIPKDRSKLIVDHIKEKRTL